MRILTVANVAPDPDRGAAGTEVRTVAALRELGHEVDCIWADQIRRRISHGNLHYLLELPYEYERVVIEALARHSYDIVHVNQPHGFRAARAVHRVAPSTAFIHRSHGLELNVEESVAPWRARYAADARKPLRRAFSRLLQAFLVRHSRAISSAADGHVVSCTADADFLTQRMGVDGSRVAVIPQAAPPSYVAAPAPEMTPQRLRRVLHVAQFAFFKAPMVTAAAIRRLGAWHPDLRFTWICDTRDHDAVRNLVGPDVMPRLELLPWTSQDELQRHYDECGVFLFPSFYEGFGKAFLEAMSRGMCVVATDVGGMHDVIDHGITGVLVPPGDAEALADGARSIIGNFERASSIARAAAESARLFTWERLARDLAAFYRRRQEAL